MKIAIVYGSYTGQTAKVAGFLQGHLQHRGHEAILVSCRSQEAVDTVASAEGVIIGAPVRAGNHHGRVVKFIKNNLDLLNKKQGAFFTVCLSAKTDDAKSRAEIGRYQEALKTKTGWQAPLMAAFAGGIAYTRYNFLIKFIIKKVSQKEGGDTDTSRDFEYTDWDQVARFADQFVR